MRLLLLLLPLERVLRRVEMQELAVERVKQHMKCGHRLVHRDERLCGVLVGDEVFCRVVLACQTVDVLVVVGRSTASTV